MARLYQWLYRVLTKVLVAVECLIGLRFALTFLKANTSTLAVKYLYSLTDPLLAPFKDIFPTINLSKFGIVGTIDTVTLSAGVGYFIAFLIFSNIFKFLGKD